MRIRKAAAIAVILGMAFIASGYYDGDQQLVEETYVVQQGDCLWSIGQEFMQKNTGGRRYILEYIEGIKEQNPWIKNERNYVLYPGDRVKVTYWVKKEGAE